jgi:hypothetical protein
VVGLVTKKSLRWMWLVPSSKVPFRVTPESARFVKGRSKHRVLRGSQTRLPSRLTIARDFDFNLSAREET